MRFKAVLLSLTFTLFTAPSFSQNLDKEAIVSKLADLMNRNYVFPEKGKAMHDLIKANLKKGEYADIVDNNAFADRLDADLKSIIHDKHIRVKFDPERIEKMKSGAANGGRKPPKNFGFEKTEVKDGIGYLDLRGFQDIRFAEDVAKEAMDKLIEADAIIFDLRKNGGGSPSMIRFISSYIFGKERVHLNDFYWRPSDSFSESWTNPDFASQHKPNIPVYVLTSNYTFSAAEEFTYNLKNLKRATIIGETTGGGAHPGGPMIIDDQFFVNVPQGRAINPITKTNWEGVGVKPDIELSAEKALEKAIKMAKNAILAKH